MGLGPGDLRGGVAPHGQAHVALRHTVAAHQNPSTHPPCAAGAVQTTIGTWTWTWTPTSLNLWGHAIKKRASSRVGLTFARCRPTHPAAAILDCQDHAVQARDLVQVPFPCIGVRGKRLRKLGAGSHQLSHGEGPVAFAGQHRRLGDHEFPRSLEEGLMELSGRQG